MADTHTFDIDVAVEYGVNAAIILWNLSFWIEKNEANDRHFYDGHYWTYSSVSAMTSLFPYMSEKTIRNTMDKLVESGLVLKGHYNQQPYDRTNWYALTKMGELICRKRRLNSVKRANGFPQKGEPIPDSITDSYTDDINTCANNCAKASERTAKFDAFWAAYPKKKSKQDAIRAFSKLSDSEIELLLPAVEKQKKWDDWKREGGKFIPYPATWLRAKCWLDEDSVDLGGESSGKWDGFV